MEYKATTLGSFYYTLYLRIIFTTTYNLVTGKFPASGKWERLQCRGEAPPALQEHSATSHAGKLYVFGGEAGALSNETPLWIYDTQVGFGPKVVMIF